MDYKALSTITRSRSTKPLDTKEKLFLPLPDDTSGRSLSITGNFRYLRATVSEMGEIDRAALEEMKHDRKFQYYAYDTTCLVENDEKPPAPMNEEALAVCLTIGKMFGMSPVPQVHTMRNLVIDGSNTSGFQRTGTDSIQRCTPERRGDRNDLPRGCRAVRLEVGRTEDVSRQINALAGRRDGIDCPV